jgi:hypothetical protein
MNIKDVVLFKGKKYKFIHTRNITLDDIRAVFFPKNFYEKYHYLGSVPWREKGGIFEAMEPLVIFMDYKARPKWCPRWILRFLHLFGDDNSIVRVRNRTLHNLKRKLTKGLSINDYKTKWDWFDLRISIYGTEQMNNLAEAIEFKFYEDGLREELAERIKMLDPKTKYDKGYTVSVLKHELSKLQNINNDDDNDNTGI